MFYWMKKPAQCNFLVFPQIVKTAEIRQSNQQYPEL